MSELSIIVKLGALFIMGMTALFIAYKCASWIYRVTTPCPPAPTVVALPVDTEQHEPENVLVFGSQKRSTA